MHCTNNDNGHAVELNQTVESPGMVYDENTDDRVRDMTQGAYKGRECSVTTAK